ncbi:MAG TPA: HAMP domain-containing sensor histidine kinase, partial [Blastocatellia bacterium]|nr:HAMP domain-containing sensor histidine kinase [Blastocatellia bacterium]
YLRDRLIPELVRNYFSGDGGLDYQVLVTSRSDPQKIIYRSEPGLSPEMSAAADITADFFDMQVEEFNGLIARRYSSNPSETAPPKRLTVTVLRSSGPPPDVRLPAPMLMLKADSKWVLALKHRAGSLDAAVAVGRRRNLAISFGILLLLAASMAFIVASTRRAERLARQQMEFVAGVSHELRTPLAVICSAGENLADGLISEREQVKQYGALIQGEGRRLSEMVEQVLEFAGIQSGRRVYKMQSVAAGDLIEGALADARLLIHESGFTVEKEIQSNLPQVMADAPALRRALVNLINNAVKYGGESRWLKIQAQTATGERGPEAQITVEDRGVGIEAGDLPHIFEPFYRGREAVASQIHGSGLGLSLVKHIVESHGGRVMAKSEPGKGSSFTISLPVPSQGSEIRSQEVEVRMSASV